MLLNFGSDLDPKILGNFWIRIGSQSGRTGSDQVPENFGSEHLCSFAEPMCDQERQKEREREYAQYF